MSVGVAAVGWDGFEGSAAASAAAAVVAEIQPGDDREQCSANVDCIQTAGPFDCDHRSPCGPSFRAGVAAAIQFRTDLFRRAVQLKAAAPPDTFRVPLDSGHSAGALHAVADQAVPGQVQLVLHHNPDPASYRPLDSAGPRTASFVDPVACSRPCVDGNWAAVAAVDAAAVAPVGVHSPWRVLRRDLPAGAKRPGRPFPSHCAGPRPSCTCCPLVVGRLGTGTAAVAVVDAEPGGERMPLVDPSAGVVLRCHHIGNMRLPGGFRGTYFAHFHPFRLKLVDINLG